MKITKLGHCCLIVEDDGKKILIDPGSFTTEPIKAVEGIDIILITHEHGDHFHIESIQAVLASNPNAIIVSNASVAKLLAEKNIACTVVGDGQSETVADVLIEGFGKDHAPIYQTTGLVENTGYLVRGEFYIPGDNYHQPGRPVTVLALPTAGPWLKLSEAIDFAKAVKPKFAFPVHDGMIVPSTGGFVATMLNNLLSPDGIQFSALDAGDSKEF